MPGRINEEDIATIRERARIEDVVGSYVTLKRAGGGSLKGLCPFHDEKTPSFQVTPSRGFYYCFGCGEGGDVISFVQRIDNLSFTEAVERLAAKVGVQLRYADDGPGAPRVEPGLRTRIMAANAEAATLFADALAGSGEAAPGRQMLDGRGFDRAVAEHFGVGWAPRGGRVLTQHLRSKGFKEDELIQAGLSRRGGYDFFQGRVVWPIRDSGSGVLGFGARRIFDDDRMPAKYINTPETPVYKKSHVLYGLDLARQNIGKKSHAVIVEGYTDVMACHIAGVDTAVASCGTAFGEDHARLIQRLLGSSGKPEVIFTFDGDAAGQAAALKVFALDREFTGQTYVAIEPTGLDPCDLRLQHGDAAVRELIARRVPLYRFVMRNVLARFDLDRADGRVAALREAAPLVTSVRDAAMVSEYTRELAGLVGMPMPEVQAEVRRAAARRPAPAPVEVAPLEAKAENPEAAQPALEAFPAPDPADRRLVVERDVAKLLLQAPLLFTQDWNGIIEEDFSHPGYVAVYRAVQAAGEPEGLTPVEWGQAVREAADSEAARLLAVELSVEPVLREATESYVDEYAAKLQLLAADRQIANLKSKLQRTNPVEHQRQYNAMFAELVEGEKRRQELQRRTWGG